MTTTRPDGLQRERTALAWQRTALSLLVACVALTRFAYDEVGPAALACLLAVPLTIAVLVGNGRSARHRTGVAAGSRGGLPGLALVAAVLLMCLTGLTIILWP